MTSLVNPADPLEVQNARLIQIADVLMRRVEQGSGDQGAAYAQFQRNVLLEDQVRARTADLEKALDLLNGSNARLGEAMAEAEAARQNLASAIETVQDGFALFDAADRLVLANSRFGLQLSDVHARLKPGLGFDDYVRLVSGSQDLLLKAGEGAVAWARARMRRHSDRDVTFIVALTGDRWLQVSEHRTRDGGTVILQTDLTEVMRLERQERGKLLDDQARMVRATLDHISQGVGIFDAEERLVGFNARLAELLALPLARVRMGLPFAALMGAAMAALAPVGVRPEAVLAWAAERAARAPMTFELARADGFVLSVQGQEMPDGGFVISFSDITADRDAQRALAEANESLERRVAARTGELAAALAQAEQANAARARFVAAASHDLLQPLSAAKLFLAALADEGLPLRAGATVAKAQNALGSVEEILGALLDISKLESGRAAVDVGAVALGQMLAQLRDEFAPLAARKGLELRVLGSRAVVDSDATYLRRILQNLIGNAVRYTVKGRVLVGVRHLTGAVRVEVIDTGPGIPEAERQAIFREFHRLNARASASEGMGLGLAIVERACALLGHPLELQSEVGRGSRFAVTVPLAAGEVRAAAGPAGAPEGLEGRIVLLVENDGDLRRALGMLLEGWGAQVLEADSAEAALALLDEIGILPDRCLIDYRLGEGMDGLALADRLRALHGALPVRLITADRSEALASAARKYGILQKPVEFQALAGFLGD
jgi:hypothetical protein